MLHRFDRAERALHWANAVLFGVLMATALALYWGPVSALVGRRPLVRQVHVVAGLLLPLPWLVARLGPWSAALRADTRRLGRFDAEDRRWARSLGRDLSVRFGKFHPLQKLNAAFTAGAVVVMLGTGSVMHWFHYFPLRWRTGATFVHDWLALGLFVVVAVHVGKALSDGEALGGMWRGTVEQAWAGRHHPRWADELSGTSPAMGSSPVDGAPKT
ncbi:MAG TPA: cytochrome b/b6 domain-containing protein [Acidimicrobiales bacterium]|nr:cytochrome b/b6 domain-containing protein [Acidimicrobiales bacterium]